jgi:YgiT-type zinc finger domain-containing protein
LFLSKGNDMKKKTLKVCSNCEGGHLHKGVRDVAITRQKLSATVKGIAGAFCDHCDEIEFDDTTDSAQRYAQAGDQLVLQNRAAAAAALICSGKNSNSPRIRPLALPAVVTMRSPGMKPVQQRP